MNKIVEKLGPGKLLALTSVVFLLIFSFYQDIYRPFYSNAHTDFPRIYNPLLINDGWKLEYYDHTAYVYFLVTAVWFKVLNFIGILEVSQFSQLPGPGARFEAIFTSLTYAGRWLSVLLAFAFTMLIYAGVKHVTARPWIAFLAAILILFSPGLVNQTLSMHTDLLAALITVLAFFLLLGAIDANGVRKAILLFSAAFAIAAAVSTKMQMAPLLLAMPILAIAFGKPFQDFFSRDARSFLETGTDMLSVAFIVGSAAYCIPAIWMFVGQIRLMGTTGLYQMAIVGYAVTAIWIYCRIYGASRLGFALGLAIVAGGFASGIYLHLITFDTKAVQFVANFLERLAFFSNFNDINLAIDVAAVGHIEFLSRIAQKLGTVVQYAFRAGFTDFRLMLLFNKFLYVIVFFGTIAAFYYRRRRLALQCSLLLLTAMGMEIISHFKYYIINYYLYISPWLIVAASLLLKSALESPRWRDRAKRANGRKVPQAVFGILIGAMLVTSTMDAYRMREWQKPNYACGKAQGYLNRMRHYFDHYCD